MKSFINRAEDVVLESLEGLCATVPHIHRLDGYPAIKVCYDARHDGGSTVSIISGGGSGHEPAYSGFVGKGMLAAAIAGDVFAAPPEDAILAAIRQVTGKPSAGKPSAGCLLIICNYTGDRLNFGAAAERAKAEGLNVELVIVADDCALPHLPSIARRGVAGVAFTIKAAGAVATAGGDLHAVQAMAQHAANSVGTMACALTTCNLPGHPPSSSATSSRLGEDEMEMGLGLHGEPGAYTSKVKPVDEIVTELVARISLPSAANGGGGGVKEDYEAYLPILPKEPVAMLINNLGGVTLLEMGVVSRAAVRAVHSVLDATIERVYVGSVGTSLDMKGVSISLLKLGNNTVNENSTTPNASSSSNMTTMLSLQDALDAETDAPGWPRHGGKYVADKEATPVPRGDLADTIDFSGGVGNVDMKHVHDGIGGGDGTSDEAIAVLLTKQCIEAACHALLDSEAELNDLDAKVGDGDCGSTLATGAQAILTALPTFQLNSAASLALSLSNAVGLNVGGTSGGVFKIFFTAAATALRNNSSNTTALTIDSAAVALKTGIEAVSKYGGAERGHRTLVDAMGPASDALLAYIAGCDGSGSATEAAAVAAMAAEKGAEETKTMRALAGRSSYVPEAVLQGVPDPGAVGVARWLRAIAETLQSNTAS